MSPNLSPRRRLVPKSNFGNQDRRSDVRYPAELDVHYHALGQESAFTGSGKTVNLSSGGILFRAPDTLPLGLEMELLIEWPVGPRGGPSVQVQLWGKVVRSSMTGSAFRITSHQIRALG